MLPLSLIKAVDRKEPQPSVFTGQVFHSEGYLLDLLSIIFIITAVGFLWSWLSWLTIFEHWKRNSSQIYIDAHPHFLLSYSKINSELYLVGRLAPNFAVACRILYEIRKRCPLFVPASLFDFASGLGTYAWLVTFCSLISLNSFSDYSRSFIWSLTLPVQICLYILLNNISSLSCSLFV